MQSRQPLDPALQANVNAEIDAAIVAGKRASAIRIYYAAWRVSPPDAATAVDRRINGYLAFIFERCGKAVMENPEEGNAIYVFGNDWKQLSQLTKTEIMQSHWNHERIIHTGEWKSRLLRCLR